MDASNQLQNFREETRLLRRIVEPGVFKFVLIEQNSPNVARDVAQFLSEQFPDRPQLELRLYGKSYREISDAILGFKEGILLLPDFDYLLQEEQYDIRVAFNQRRDLYGQKPVIFLVFLERTGARQIPRLLPDWYSVRSLELDMFYELENSISWNYSERNTNNFMSRAVLEDRVEEIGRLRDRLSEIPKEDKHLSYRLHETLGKILQSIGEYSLAETHFNDALNLAKVRDSTSEIANIHRYIGRIRLMTGNPTQALEYFQKSLKLDTSQEDRKGRSIDLCDIASVKVQQGQLQQAMELYTQSLEIDNELGDALGVSITLLSIASILEKQGKLHEAMSIYEESLEIRKELKDTRGIALTLHSIASVLAQQGQLQQAIKFYTQTLDINKKLGDTRSIGITLYSMANVLSQQGYFQQAKELYEQALKIHKRLGDTREIAVTSAMMGKLIGSMGDYQTGIPLLFEATIIAQQLNYHEREDIQKDFLNVWLTYLHQNAGENTLKQFETMLKINDPEFINSWARQNNLIEPFKGRED